MARLKHMRRRARADRMRDPTRAGSYAAIADKAVRCKIARMLDPRAQHLLKTLVERYIAEGQPVGSRALSRQSGPRAVAGDDPQRDGRPRGAGLHREPAHLGRAHSDGQGLPLLRRHA